jgi:hypothetical protein
MGKLEKVGNHLLAAYALNQIAQETAHDQAPADSGQHPTAPPHNEREDQKKRNDIHGNDRIRMSAKETEGDAVIRGPLQIEKWQNLVNFAQL